MINEGRSVSIGVAQFRQDPHDGSRGFLPRLSARIHRCCVILAVHGQRSRIDIRAAPKWSVGPAAKSYSLPIEQLRYLAASTGNEDGMAKAAKLIAMKRGKVLLVRRRVDGLWMFPGGRRRPGEDDKECLRREIAEELPKLKFGRLVLWREATTKNKYSGRRMSDALFIAKKTSGRLEIGDKKELDKAVWRKPDRVRLTPTSRYIRDKLFT